MTVDVGTGSALQVPSLHGLALRAPYMHDGCAETLLDRSARAAAAIPTA
jgi:cytochrome c peroxidase